MQYEHLPGVHTKEHVPSPRTKEHLPGGVRHQFRCAAARPWRHISWRWLFFGASNQKIFLVRTPGRCFLVRRIGLLCNYTYIYIYIYMCVYKYMYIYIYKYLYLYLGAYLFLPLVSSSMFTSSRFSNAARIRDGGAPGGGADHPSHCVSRQFVALALHKEPCRRFRRCSVVRTLRRSSLVRTTERYSLVRAYVYMYGYNINILKVNIWQFPVWLRLIKL